MPKSNSIDFSSEIWVGVKEILRSELEGPLTDADLVSRMKAMTKAEIMDRYLYSLKEQPGVAEICRVVNEIFGIDLDTVTVLSEGKAALLQDCSSSGMSSSRTAIHSYLANCGSTLTGKEIREMINDLFGINLTAISTLEKARISLYSKGQWIVEHDKDLFVVYAGNRDVDVKVFPTEYFTEQTGLKSLPHDLQRSLLNIGFYYNEEIGSYYFSNPDGQAVTDDFKGQTMRAIGEVISKQFPHL